MKENLTELVFILDRSGSMQSMQEEAIGGFNAFLEDQKKVPGEAKLTLVLFDHEYNLVHNGKDINDIESLCSDTYAPRGTTALLDAIGRTVDDVGKRLAETPEEERPSKILVAVLTDGLENASRDYKKAKINEMITHQRDKYCWEFIFLGANQDAIAEGSSLGVSKIYSMTYSATPNGMKNGMRSMSYAASSYRRTGKVDLKDVDQNTEDKDVISVSDKK
ncbi:hypothetical protein LCGC14_1789700 [marine sediment metagenome]|uniref:VWFA domain-containing protein n=1 Tax=marine sediment metagenome TaxID=412755 RepID=A0A0F9GSX8_9ZZZZ